MSDAFAIENVAPHPDVALLFAALEGQAGASQALMKAIEPVVRQRVVRWMRRVGPKRCARLRLEASDLIQEILVAFYEDDARLLRAWDPERGLSLRNWVGLLTPQLLGKRLAHIKWLQFEHADPYAVDAAASREDALEARDELTRVLRQIEPRLSPRALAVLVGTCLSEDASAIGKRAGMSEQAVYAARLRLTKLIRELEPERGGERRPAIRPLPRPALALPNSPLASRST